MFNKILLDFTKKDYSEASSFDDMDLIHTYNMEKAVGLFGDLYASSVKARKEYSGQYHECNNTISVFASRGAGKTSFLLTLLDKIKKQWPDAFCLELIDPSHIESKQQPFVNIIAAIQKNVDDAIYKMIDVSPRDDKYENLKSFKNSYSRLLKGMNIVNGVGDQNIYGSWNDDDYISYQGMEKAKACNNLRESVHDYLNQALKILNKDCFVIAFDDIDTTYEKGFEILEIIRKYLASPFVITILTGDQGLYTKLIRKHHWNFFDDEYINKERNYSSKDAKDFSRLINQLENQYMVKVLKPENRIILYSIKEYINQEGYTIDVKFDDQTEQSLEECYEEMLSNLKASSGSKNKIARFLMGLSLRVQIRILTLWNITLKRNEKDTQSQYHYRRHNIGHNIEEYAQKYMVDGLMDIFSSDIYQIANNAKDLIHGDNLYSTFMLSLLVNNKCLDSETSFMPETNNETLNKALFAVSIKMDQYLNMSYGKYLVFDFWLRICYAKFLNRKIGEGDTNKNESDLLKYSGMASDMGLIKAVGLSQAFLNSLYDVFRDFDLRIMPGTIYLGNSIPDKLLETNQYMPTLPLLGTINDRNNEKVFVSIYRLFSVLSEFMLRVKFHPNREDEYYISMFKKLAQYRTFIEKPKDTISPNANKEKGFDSFSFKDEPLLDNTVKKLRKWCDNRAPVSVQQLDKIFTRFYYTLLNIEKSDFYENVGDKFNAIICALINSSLVEEAIETYNTDIILTNNGRIELIFLYNISKLREKYGSYSTCKFTAWLIECPILDCYMNPIVSHLLHLRRTDQITDLVDVVLYGNNLNNLEILETKKKEKEIISSNYQKDITLLYKLLMWNREKTNLDLDKQYISDKYSENRMMPYEEYKKMKEEIENKEKQIDIMRLSLRPVLFPNEDLRDPITTASSEKEIFEAIDYINIDKLDCDNDLKDLEEKINVIQEKNKKISHIIKEMYKEINEKSHAHQSMFGYFKNIPL